MQGIAADVQHNKLKKKENRYPEHTTKDPLMQGGIWMKERRMNAQMIVYIC